MEKAKVRLIILAAIFAVGTVTLTIVFWPFIRDLQNPEYREAFSLWVQGLGFYGVLILFGIHALQMVVAIIPGGPVALVAGAAYGAWIGTAIIVAGCVFTSTIIFFMVKKFGLPLLRRFFGEKDINNWIFLKDTRKVARAVFLLFLIPGTPKDLLTWLCPITRLTLGQFVVLSTLGRIPAILTTAIMGDSMIQGNWVLSVSIFAGIAVIGFLGMWFRDKIYSVPKFTTT
ncbi:MAG: VTT domain-containing protein [Treponema sp.]|jgi:uncharacterized membrane protein YdjX (TVP38/TMEM64 family)|nr:VTT domain-containing protein [Treponema sp.]